MRPGDVVTVEFPGAEATKRRPAVVVSSDAYQRSRPDVILGILTSQTSASKSPTDYVLIDWREAGLRSATAFRAFFATTPASTVRKIGKLSQSDWDEVKARVALAIAH